MSSSLPESTGDPNCLPSSSGRHVHVTCFVLWNWYKVYTGVDMCVLWIVFSSFSSLAAERFWKQSVCLHGLAYSALFTLLFTWNSLCHVQLSMTPRTAAHQASLSLTISWSLPKFMSIESVMPSNTLILVALFSFCPQSFPTSGSCPQNQLFASDRPINTIGEGIDSQDLQNELSHLF